MHHTVRIENIYVMLRCVMKIILSLSIQVHHPPRSLITFLVVYIYIYISSDHWWCAAHRWLTIVLPIQSVPRFVAKIVQCCRSGVVGYGKMRVDLEDFIKYLIHLIGRGSFSCVHWRNFDLIIAVPPQLPWNRASPFVLIRRGWVCRNLWTWEVLQRCWWVLQYRRS